MNDFMELRRVTIIIVRWWWLLVLSIAIGAGIGYAISRGQTPVYLATTTVLVGESIQSSRVDRVDIQVSEALVLTYVEIARRQPVLQGVVTTLNLNESWQNLGRRVTINQIESTQIIEIGVEADSRELAQSIADEIVNQLILLSPSSSESAENQLTNSFNREQITNLQERIVNGQKRLAEIETAINNSISEFELTALQQEKTNLEGLIIEWERNYTQLLTLTEPKRDPTRLTVVEPAHSGNRIIRPLVPLNTIVGGGVGMILALGLIFLLDFLDDTYRSLKDFPQSEEVNILGSIRRIKGKKLSDKIIAQLQPHSPITESYRIIRSRIRFKRGDNPARSIMVTSSMPEEGKSLTAANLAVVFAQANFKTVIVDADLRHPVLHELFEVENEAGLGDVLSSHAMRVEECIKNTPVDNLQILTSGKALPDPSGQLGSERMEEIIMDLKKIAEIVIFDSPPVLVFADAIALSRRIDGIIVVIKAGKSKRSAINQTLLDLQNANANLLGSIFNQSPKSDTFSVNKVYMQERPQLPFARVLAKKENPFHDLRDSATPLHEFPVLPELDSKRASVITTEFHDLDDSATRVNENLEISGLEGEKAGIDGDQFLDLGDSAVPAIENLEMPGSGNGSRATKTNIPHDSKTAKRTNHKKPTLMSDLDDSTTPTNEYLEMSDSGSEKATVDETQFHDLGDSATPINEILEVSGLESEEAVVDETQISGLGDSAIPANENLETSDLEGEKARIDEVQMQELGDSTIPASENLESPPLDSEAYVKETSVQPKKKRTRKSKRKELQNEVVPVAAPDVPVEQTNE
ncbi:MAG TPA: polysaccharide biosynthesis tyrosine autokinase [Anaerolineales bacterium]|nr:polysaccharide biosynthesis tyrosine autokinase [Anaerolineales bacterium]